MDGSVVLVLALPSSQSVHLFSSCVGHRLRIHILPHLLAPDCPYPYPLHLHLPPPPQRYQQTPPAGMRVSCVRFRSPFLLCGLFPHENTILRALSPRIPCFRGSLSSSTPSFLPISYPLTIHLRCLWKRMRVWYECINAGWMEKRSGWTVTTVGVPPHPGQHAYTDLWGPARDRYCCEV